MKNMKNMKKYEKYEEGGHSSKKTGRRTSKSLCNLSHQAGVTLPSVLLIIIDYPPGQRHHHDHRGHHHRPVRGDEQGSRPQ